MSFDDVARSLREVRWGSAADWDPRARAWVDAYYRRLLPIWPVDRRALDPANRIVEDAAFAPRSDADRARIAAQVKDLIAEARGRGERVESATQKLVACTLAWALAVDGDELAPEADPGGPLRELFSAGYQIHYTPHGIELHYATGFMTMPVPTRASLA